jgi:hypothetical protein
MGHDTVYVRVGRSGFDSRHRPHSQNISGFSQPYTEYVQSGGGSLRRNKGGWNIKLTTPS